MKNITIIASESDNGFDYCTTEFNGEIEETGYTLYHYYDQIEKISRLTAGVIKKALDDKLNEIHRETGIDYYKLIKWEKKIKDRFETDAIQSVVTYDHMIDGTVSSQLKNLTRFLVN